MYLTDRNRLAEISRLTAVNPRDPVKKKEIKKSAQKLRNLIKDFQEIQQLKILHIFFSEHYIRDMKIADKDLKWLSQLAKLASTK